MACQHKGFLKAGDLQEMTLAAWSIAHGFAMLRIDHHIPEEKLSEKRLNTLKRSVVMAIFQGLRPE
jgi:hypothetical protein